MAQADQGSATQRSESSEHGGANRFAWPSAPDRLVVVIANYNSALETDRCIDSLEAADRGTLCLRTIVIDNSDAAPPYSHPRATVDWPGENIGLGGAWARGFAFAESDGANYCLFLNNDAVVDPDFFIEMQRGIKRHGPNAVLGPRILTENEPGRVWSRGGTISPWRATVHHFGGQEDAAVPSQDFETGHLSGCCLLVPMVLLRRIGGPDDRFFFRGEEWDLNHRLSKAGGRLMICDSARVKHRIGGSHERFSPRMLYFAYRAKVLFARKHQAPVWFPLWFTFGLVYAGLFAPIKFAVWSRRCSSWSDLWVLQRALVRAFWDGLRKDRIEGTDYGSRS